MLVFTGGMYHYQWELVLPLTKNQPEGGFFTSNPILFGLTCFVISTHNYLLVYFTRVSIVLQ